MANERFFRYTRKATRNIFCICVSFFVNGRKATRNFFCICVSFFVTRRKLSAISSASVFLFSLHEESFAQYLLHLCFFFRYTRKASRNIFCVCVSVFVTRVKLRAIFPASVFLFSLHEESYTEYLLHLCFFFCYTRKATRNIFCICVSLFVTRGKLLAISSASVFLFSIHEESFAQYLLHLCFFFRYTRKASRNIFCICVSFCFNRLECVHNACK